MSSISPEKWHLIPTEPRFGSLIDPNGGRVYRSPDVENIDNLEKEVDTLRETSIGLVEMHTVENGFRIHAVERGIGLFYDKNGSLADVGVEVLSFCDSCSEKDYKKMGGDNLDEMLAVMMDTNEQMFLSFDFKESTVAVAKLHKVSGKGDILSSVEKQNFSLATVMKVKYDEFDMYVGFEVIEDVFYFGVLVMQEGEKLTLNTRMFMTAILNDCNYKTFLTSLSPDRYEKLTRRIFIKSR